MLWIFCVCVWPKLWSHNSNSTKKGNLQSVSPGRLNVHFSFKNTKPFLSWSKQFCRTKIVDKCKRAFVFVYNQSYALVIVTQQKEWNWQNILPGILSVHLLFKYTKPFFKGHSNFIKIEYLISARVILCLCMTKITLS